MENRSELSHIDTWVQKTRIQLESGRHDQLTTPDGIDLRPIPNNPGLSSDELWNVLMSVNHIGLVMQDANTTDLVVLSRSPKTEGSDALWTLSGTGDVNLQQPGTQHILQGARVELDQVPTVGGRLKLILKYMDQKHRQNNTKDFYIIFLQDIQEVLIGNV